MLQNFEVVIVLGVREIDSGSDFFEHEFGDALPLVLALDLHRLSNLPEATVVILNNLVDHHPLSELVIHGNLAIVAQLRKWLGRLAFHLALVAEVQIDLEIHVEFLVFYYGVGVDAAFVEGVHVRIRVDERRIHREPADQILVLRVN